MKNRSAQIFLLMLTVFGILTGCSSPLKDDRSPAMARKSGSSDLWSNPNVPKRIPILQPSNYPTWSDPGSILTDGTPEGCDPHVFVPQFGRGDALNDYFTSNNDDREPQDQLKDYFNGHPIRFPRGKILFPVGVGKVKDPSKLENLFSFEKRKSATVEDSKSDQFCTTYLNEGNKSAQNLFQWIFIPTSEKGKTTDPKRVAEASKVYVDAFEKLIGRLIECEDQYGYYAFGCQSAFERTPTILAMVLKELGCSTENSVFIADMLLGRNDIPLETRKAIVDQTPIDAATRKKLQDLFWGIGPQNK